MKCNVPECKNTSDKMVFLGEFCIICHKARVSFQSSDDRRLQEIELVKGLVENQKGTK